MQIKNKMNPFCLRLSDETLKKLEAVAGDNVQEKVTYLINANHDMVNHILVFTPEQIENFKQIIKNNAKAARIENDKAHPLRVLIEEGAKE